tara:strand:- start:14 stop:451 length:438 start_codon:yes stop_codon:yes gene_type:complete
MIQITEPLTDSEFDEYYNLRWCILRKPLGLEKGTEKDELEKDSIHKIVKYNNVIVGIGRMHFNDNDVAQIRYMAVSKTSRGMGFGKLIVDNFIEISKNKNISKIILYARESVIEFYQKLGFNKIKKAHRLKGVQHFLMERKNNYE